MKTLLLTVALVALLVTTTSSATRTQPAAQDLPAALAKTIDDRNAADFAALFTENGVFNDLGTVKRGRAAIAGFAQEIIDFQGKYVTRSVTVNGERVRWLSDFTGGGGSYRLRGQGDFQLERGFIRTLEIARQP